MRCAICDQEFDPAHSPAMPFCSERCKQIDLGRWIDEKYSMPIERPESADDEFGEGGRGKAEGGNE
jgi:endogenous inhibitor of DNA gyrase (YacG/DUF329 family)